LSTQALEKLIPQGRYEKASLAADVHGVMQALAFECYAVCGHDIGAMTELALACTHREAVTHLAILDASMPGRSQWKLISQPQMFGIFRFI